MEGKAKELDTLEALRKASRRADTERALILGYLQGLEAAALAMKPDAGKKPA